MNNPEHSTPEISLHKKYPIEISDTDQVEPILDEESFTILDESILPLEQELHKLTELLIKNKFGYGKKREKAQEKRMKLENQIYQLKILVYPQKIKKNEELIADPAVSDVEKMRAKKHIEEMNTLLINRWTPIKKEKKLIIQKMTILT